MNIIRLALAGVMLTAMTACSSAGNSSMKNVTVADIDRNVRDGVTTSAQVRQLYGEPAATSYDNGNEVWNYEFVSDRPDGLSMAQDAVGLGFLGTKDSMRSNALELTFRNGIVVHHSFTTKNIGSGSGLRR
ncbi:hypothetical protein [Neoasaia chiangmaiensis]|uniref:Lipoprotein SmpA/OmlA domain-containing protein n=1 Tax=Neoasaia chiangmaiensis TaxID=320497 RepID=A0A1U9KNY8_9PROT|nr:hypothetical protein [Neoasaia chiangmaiensis]AQS87469.1 hypothetical protein A0U93_05415 [Neoasaia chiangmaiensis]